jgi:hypothetical protein
MAKPPVTEMTEFVPNEKFVAQARETLAGLERKHADALARQTMIAHDRRKIGFDAHTGDKAARAQLDNLNREAVTLAAELDSLAAAVAEASDRLTRAEAEVAQAQAAARAAHVRDELVPAFIEAGKLCAEGLDVFTANYARCLNLAAEIARRGGGIGPENVRVLVWRGVQARLAMAPGGRLNTESLPAAATSVMPIEKVVAQFATTAKSRCQNVIDGGAVPVIPVAPPRRGEPTATFEPIPGEEYLDDPAAVDDDGLPRDPLDDVHLDYLEPEAAQ